MQCERIDCNRAVTVRGAHGVFCGPECAYDAWCAMTSAERSRVTTTSVGDDVERAPSEDSTTNAALADGQRVQVARLDLCSVGLGREEMGRAWWTALHAMARALVDDPATGELAPRAREAATAIVDALTVVYPCEMCRKHYAAMHRAHPPRFRRAADVVCWLCERHNSVNARLGKPLQPVPCVHDAVAPDVPLGCEAH